MNSKQSVARTAYRVMFYVALEQYQPVEQRLFEDDLARLMLPPRLQSLLTLFGLRPLREGFLKLIEWGFPGTAGGLCRKCYIDDQLSEALDAGLETVMILGAGLDTRAYRMPQLASVPVYEVDLPQMITYKENKLVQIFGRLPENLVLIPMDFDHQVLGEILDSYGFSSNRKTFIILEGVTQYIDETSVRKIFEFLAGVGPGSRIVFSYIVKDFIDGEKTYGLKRLSQQTKLMWRFGFDPLQVGNFLGEYSWKELEQVGAKEYRERYLLPLGRTSSVMEIERIVVAEKI